MQWQNQSILTVMLMINNKVILNSLYKVGEIEKNCLKVNILINKTSFQNDKPLIYAYVNTIYCC